MHNFITAVRGKPISGPRALKGPSPGKNLGVCQGPRQEAGACDTAEKRFKDAEERSLRLREDLEIQLARENFFRGMNLGKGSPGSAEASASEESSGELRGRLHDEDS